MLGCVAQIIFAAELFETNEVFMFCTQGKEQIRARRKAIDWAVVNDRRDVGRGT